MFAPSLPASLPLFGQGTATAAALGLAMLAPPANGAMVAVPLTGGSAATAINVALLTGGSVEGRGLMPGSIVIRGERARLSAPLRVRGFVLLTAAPGLCA